MRMDELTALWDSHIRDWMKGGKPAGSRLLDWQKTYRGEGDGAVAVSTKSFSTGDALSGGDQRSSRPLMGELGQVLTVPQRALAFREWTQPLLDHGELLCRSVGGRAGLRCGSGLPWCLVSVRR